MTAMQALSEGNESWHRRVPRELRTARALVGLLQAPTHEISASPEKDELAGQARALPKHIEAIEALEESIPNFERTVSIEMIQRVCAIAASFAKLAEALRDQGVLAGHIDGPSMAGLSSRARAASDRITQAGDEAIARIESRAQTDPMVAALINAPEDDEPYEPLDDSGEDPVTLDELRESLGL